MHPIENVIPSIRACLFKRCGVTVIIFSCLFAGISFSAPEEKSEPAERKYFFKDVAQDGLGFIWAIKTEITVLNGGEWKTVPVYFPGDADHIREGLASVQMSDEFSFPLLLTLSFFDKGRPMRLTRMQDGSMACVWQLPGGRIGVSQHSCRKAPQRSWMSHLHRFVVPEHLAIDLKIPGECDGIIENSGLRAPPFADSHNQLWIMDKANIYRANRDGGVSLAYSIKPEELIDAKSPMPAVVFATEDGRGRAWLWSNSWSGGKNSIALRGVLVFTGDKAERHETFAGIHGDRFSFIDRKDDKHMWVATIQEGAFTVDIDTMEATPLAGPEPGAFDWVKKIFPVGNDLYVIASRTGDIFVSTLWRLHGGKWERLVDNVDNRFNPFFDYDRNWFQAGKDIALCSFDSAPWIIHEDGSVERLDWQRGYKIEDARHIFRLPDGSIFAWGTIGRTFHGNVSLEPGAGKKSRSTELVIAYHGWAADAEGNIWAVLSGKEHILNAWDGEKWTPHPFPADIGKMHMLGARADTLGRIWLFPNNGEHKAAFFDSRKGEWKTFLKIETAFEAMKDEPPQFVGSRPEQCAPCYSEDGRRIAFRNAAWEIVYYDGTDWKRWKRADIEPNSNPNYFTLDPPFFDKTGQISVNFNKQTWQLDGQGHWQQAEAEIKSPIEPDVDPRRRKIAAPEGCVTDSPDSIAIDNKGTYWLTWKGRLFKCSHGNCMPVFSEDEPNPFSSGRKILQAWVDRRGNAFLKTAFDKYIMIAPEPGSKTKVESPAGNAPVEDSKPATR